MEPDETHEDRTPAVVRALVAHVAAVPDIGDDDDLLEAYCSPWCSRDRILEDGWFRTGDLVRRDEEGNIFLLGRIKHLINVGGNKIFPCEIEQVLASHDAVLEAVGVAESDEILGEVPSAFVVLRGGMRVTSEALTARCRSRLSHFKIPRHIRIVDSLPRTHSGKIAVSALTGNRCRKIGRDDRNRTGDPPLP